ncbi:MAG TPA: hypothetical protein VN867_09250, partial [Candidatus Binataceae bacterium]|nr:hypothetical protein [Candidatus Binataceae bacterium]
TIVVAALEGCTYTHATYDNAPAYPTNGFVGSGPLAYGPHDPYGSYYQNYYPVPSYYEPPYNERACDDPRCAAIPVPPPRAVQPPSAEPPPAEQNALAPNSANSGPKSIERTRADRVHHPHSESSSD